MAKSPQKIVKKIVWDAFGPGADFDITLCERARGVYLSSPGDELVRYQTRIGKYDIILESHPPVPPLTNRRTYRMIINGPEGGFSVSEKRDKSSPVLGNFFRRIEKAYLEKNGYSNDREG